MSFKVPEKYRDLTQSTLEDGNNGIFFIPDLLRVIASDGLGWEHVSVSKKYEMPSWEEMCKIKELFWDDPEDWAIQYHPRKSSYVNNHSFCLHLWCPVDKSGFKLPDSFLVGSLSYGKLI